MECLASVKLINSTKENIMKIITTQTAVYTFNELSNEAQQKAIEKECEVLSENWQADWCIESCNEWLSMLGFSETKIYYRGFWSQGDGACFIGRYAFKKDIVEKITTEFQFKMQDVAKRLQELQEKVDYSLSATISHRGMYYHENSMDFSIDMDTDEFDCDVEKSFIKVCQDIAIMIYNYIYECYESETSGEYAKENILNSENEYLENGTVYY